MGRMDVMPDRKTGVFAALPFIAAVVGLLSLQYIKFTPSLSATETALTALTAGAVPTIVERRPITVPALESPIKIPRAEDMQKKSFPGEPLANMAPPPGQHGSQAASVPRPDVVTMIVVNNDNRMAIINGIVVKEGDKINSSAVVKIEKNRVLLKDKRGPRWLTIN